MDLDAILAELDKLADQGEKGKDGYTSREELFSKALHSKHAKLWNHISNFGYAKAKKEYDDNVVPGKDTEIAQLKDQLKDRDTRITELSKDKPDIEGIRTQYQGQITTLEANQKTELEKRDSELAKLRFDGAKRDLREMLNGKLLPKAIRLEVENAALDRLMVRKDGTVGVRVKPGEDAELITPSGKTQFEALAEEILANADDDWVIVDSDTGTGIRNNGTNNPGRSGKPGTLKIDVEAMKNQGKAEAKSTLSVAEKTGVIFGQQAAGK